MVPTVRSIFSSPHPPPGDTRGLLPPFPDKKAQLPTVTFFWCRNVEIFYHSAQVCKVRLSFSPLLQSDDDDLSFPYPLFALPKLGNIIWSLPQRDTVISFSLFNPQLLQYVEGLLLRLRRRSPPPPGTPPCPVVSDHAQPLRIPLFLLASDSATRRPATPPKPLLLF